MTFASVQFDRNENFAQEKPVDSDYYQLKKVKNPNWIKKSL